MCIDVRIDMRMGMCADVRIHVCVDQRADMCIDIGRLGSNDFGQAPMPSIECSARAVAVQRQCSGSVAAAMTAAVAAVAAVQWQVAVQWRCSGSAMVGSAVATQ